MAKYLKRVLFILVILAVSFRMGAQDPEYFIYLQSERSQPFYVRYDGKLLSSSDKGYLIISKLHTGTTSLRIGFANSSIPEQQFLVRLSGGNDQGYLIKKSGDEGFALYNLQTFAVIKPGKEIRKEPVVAAAVVKDTVVPVVSQEISEPVPVNTDAPTDATMASLKKDLDSTFANKSDITVGPGSRPVNPVPPPVPVKAGNKFAEALDKVISDDRPDEAPVEETVAIVPAVDSSVAAATGDVSAAAGKKGRRKRRDREALTPEEQQLAAAVIADERQAAAADSTTIVPVATEASTPVAEADNTTIPVVTKEVPPVTVAVPEEVPAPEKKSKKNRNKKTNDPAFIDFMDDSTKQVQTPAVVATEPEFVAPEVAPSKKKKRSKVAEKNDNIDTLEHANNVVTDSSSAYAVTDLSIDHPKESKKDKKKKKQAENIDEGGGIVAPVVAAVPAVSAEDRPASLKMINSDCGNVLDDVNFRKVLRKFVGGKDDDGMIDVFRRQTKGYCLETSQIKTLVQLLGTNETRYRLLDLAYPKVSDSEHFSSLENVLTDDYYKGRFKAMLHK
ncbi:DUF4476 domain-containing protein [Chitinophaga sp. CF118]|uniref:DUF4476 domain-containing protein n=1 Tax=Chitinophaga sp. CF118 TaxID=1884367 RepID=UPI0015A6E001|nr:DUF4476 domain-containing protein [Chitinophaga sp. CF118]